MNLSALAITQDTKYKQFIKELQFALRGLTTEELLSILKTASLAAGKQTISKKVEMIKSFSAFANRTYTRYKSEGLLNSLQNDITAAKNFTVQIPDKVENIYSNFIKLSREEQIEQTAVLLLTLSIFFMSAGGSDIEGGLPDMDIALGGMGTHRNWFSHTILLGFGIEIGARTGILLLEKLNSRLPVEHLPLWDKTYDFINKNKELGINAMWAGIGIHLLKDSGIITGGTKAYTGLPGSMPMSGHQSLFAANGLACEMFAIKNKL